MEQVEARWVSASLERSMHLSGIESFEFQCTAQYPGRSGTRNEGMRYRDEKIRVAHQRQNERIL